MREIITISQAQILQILIDTVHTIVQKLFYLKLKFSLFNTEESQILSIPISSACYLS